MAGDVFGSLYSRAYDTFYGEKDYKKECALLEELMDRYADFPVKTVFDFGCGTGSHLIPLAARGYQMTGVDISSTMLEYCRAKVEALPLEHRPSIIRGDIRNIAVDDKFHAVLMMFAVLGYQLENSAVLETLRNARRHLLKGGVVIFDCWYGPAVLMQRPSDRVRTMATRGGFVLRCSEAQLDLRNHVCEVLYRVWEIDRSQLVGNAEEKHFMRFFFPKEIELFLELSGFRLLRLGAFPNFDDDPGESTWNILVVAKAL